jgi:hypothetical protein
MSHLLVKYSRHKYGVAASAKDTGWMALLVSLGHVTGLFLSVFRLGVAAYLERVAKQTKTSLHGDMHFLQSSSLKQSWLHSLWAIRYGGVWIRAYLLSWNVSSH